MGNPLGPVQVIPPGLLGFLQLKTSGSAPDQLLGQYECSIEMRDWFFQARRIDEFAQFGNTPTTNAIATGGIGTQGFLNTGGPILVPNGQNWYVEQLSVDGNIATAADTIHYVGIVISPNNATIVQVTNDSSDVITARARNVTAYAPRGFWMAAGDALRVNVLDVLSVGGITLKARMRFTVVQI